MKVSISKLCSNPIPYSSALYKFNIDLFGNGEAEDHGIAWSDFNTTILASGMLEMGANIQYLSTIFLGEFLCQFDSLSAEMEGVSPLTLETIILGLV